MIEVTFASKWHQLLSRTYHKISLIMNHENFGFLLHNNNGAQASKHFGHCLWFALQSHIGPCTAIQSISASDTLNTEFLSTLSYLTFFPHQRLITLKRGSSFGRKTHFPSQTEWFMELRLDLLWQNVSTSHWLVDDIIRDLQCAVYRTRKWLNIMTSSATTSERCWSFLCKYYAAAQRSLCD